MAAVLFHSADERQVTASAALDSGDIILSADGKAMVIVALSGVENGRIARGQVSGVFAVDCGTSTTFSAGDLVYLTEATQVAATTSGAGKILIGTAAYAKVSGPAIVYVDLNGTRTSIDDWS
jgi:predicted RecA/RadA family phage recombinase